MIVWLASYPRSGNTFLRILLNQGLGLNSYSVYDDTDDIAPDDATRDLVGHQPLPDGFCMERAQAASQPYFIKTHDHAPPAAGPAIYIVRDGRASLWSFKNYWRDYGYGDLPLRAFINGEVEFGCWADHLRSWRPHERADTLLLHFESVVKDPMGALDQIGRFLNVQPSSTELKSFAQLHSMNPRMFRSGTDLAWADHFSVRDHHDFWSRCGDMMQAYGYSRDVL